MSRRWLQAEAECVSRPLAQLIVERARVRREFQGAEVAEALQPQADVMPAVRDADEGAADLLEIPGRVVGQRLPRAGRPRAETGAQGVPARPDGLERRAGREADLALDAVDLDGGGESVAVPVDALGDANAATGRWRGLPCRPRRRRVTLHDARCAARRRRGRCGERHLIRCAGPVRPRAVDRVDHRIHRVPPQTNVLAVHLTSPTMTASAGQGRLGQTCLSGLSLTSCQAPDVSRPARLTMSPSSVRTTKRRPTRRRRLAWLTRIEQPSTSVGSMDSPQTWMTRQWRATSPCRASHVRRHLIRPVTRSWSTTAPSPASRGEFRDTDVVAVIEGRGARVRVIEARSGGVERADQLAGGPGVIGEPVEVVTRHVERPGGGAELVDGEARVALLDHRDRHSAGRDLGSELALGDPPERAGCAQALSDDAHPHIVITNDS